MVVTPLGQPLIDTRIAEFRDETTILTDGKGRHLVVMRVLARHIGVKAFKPVSQPFFDELVQRAVDGRRRDGSLGTQLVKHLIGRKRILGSAQYSVNALLRVVQLLKGTMVVVRCHDGIDFQRRLGHPYTS